MSSARKGAACLLAFLVCESLLYSHSLAYPAVHPLAVLEGPLSLVLLALGLGLLVKEPASRKLGLAAAVALGLLVLACLVPLTPLPASDHRLEVRKAQRTVTWSVAGKTVGQFPVALGPDPTGDKSHQGDGRTPEGRYLVCDKATEPFHKWLGLSYPSSSDAWQARRQGLLTWAELCLLRWQNLNGRIPYGHGTLGGEIGIHGGGGTTGKDWTLGCVALDNKEVDRLYEGVPLGATVDILP